MIKLSRYSQSENHLQKAERLIPLGSQTFSKSKTQYPVGISPFYLKKAKGSHVWDLDNNKYIDLVNSLAAITLGYGIPKLNKAAMKQLKSGTIYSLPGTLEYEVSVQLVNLIPSAEMVRFGKNGSDVTSAAIRIARAYTNREHIAVCGYHGWQDWYIGSTTRNKGVPKSVSELTHSFLYNKIETLKEIFSKYPNQVAAVIIEPMNNEYPQPYFLEEIRNLCNKETAVLIFDETITGFRFSKGGAQEVFNVTPDLSTFGKGIANGFPLSALVGKSEIMKEIENVFYSGTFAGDLLSLAVAKEVLIMHENNLVAETLIDIGTSLSEKVESVIDQTGMNHVLKLSGHPTWRFLNWSSINNISIQELKTYFMQEIFARGLLLLGTHNVSTAISDKDISRIVSIYQDVLSDMCKFIENGTLQAKLKVKPLEPIFKVR